MKAALPLGLLLLVGCRKGEPPIPLDQGRSWTYRVFNGEQTFVEPVEVRGTVPVGAEPGVILTGPMGTCHLGWSEGTLYASRLANAAFDPPVPLALESGGKRSERSWRGTIESFGLRRTANAKLSQERLTMASNGVRYSAIRTTLNLVASAEGGAPTDIEVVTLFRPGVGIVEQVQRTNRVHIVTLKLLE